MQGVVSNKICFDKYFSEATKTRYCYFFTQMIDVLPCVSVRAQSQHYIRLLDTKAWVKSHYKQLQTCLPRRIAQTPWDQKGGSHSAFHGLNICSDAFLIRNKG